MALLKILIIAFLGVAVVGGGTYLVMNNTAKVETDEANTENNEERREEGSNTLRGLLALGESLTCTFTSEIGGSGTTEGTMYVSGGKMRGDFTIAQNGSTFDSHMIVRDEKMYAWTVSSQGTFAYELELDQLDGGDTPSSNNSQNPVSLDQVVDYDCSPWSGETAKFELPSGIDFQTYEEMFNTNLNVQGNVGAGVSGSASQCAACEQIPNADAKAQCLASLSCN